MRLDWAGMARMPYRRFFVFNAAGGLIWAVGLTLLGFAAGASYKRVESVAARPGKAFSLAFALAVWCSISGDGRAAIAGSTTGVLDRCAVEQSWTILAGWSAPSTRCG